MSLICIWRNWIRSVFRLLFRRGAEKRDNDLYVETLTEYLLHHRSLRLSRSSSARLLLTGRKKERLLRSLSNPSLRSLSLSKGIPQHGRPCASTCSAPASPQRSLSNPSLRSLSLSKGIPQKDSQKGMPQGHYLASTSSATVPPMSKGIPQKNLPMKGLWKGTVSSLTEAYTFLLNLPGVCLSRVECYMIADRLVYQVQINRQMVIIMREHAKGFDRWVDLTLLESKKPRLQIRLRLCEVVTRELVGH